MVAYILRRVLQVIPVFFGATLLIYFMVFAMPGDPVVAMFGEKTPRPEQVEALRQQYGLDQPFIVQYITYLSNVFQGDLGQTFARQGISDVLARTFPVTLRLAVMAVAMALVLAVVVGTVSALRKGGILDNLMLVIALIFVAVPIFVVGLLAQQAFGVQLGWFSPTVGADAGWGNLWLPAITLAISIYAASMRLTRSSTIETLGQDGVRTAYAKGLPRRRVLPVHVMRNSLIPTVTDMGTQFGVLMVGATVTEAIFNVPGVGSTLYQAILRGDNQTVVSFVTVFVILYVFVNLAIDLLYGVLDPRIRYGT